MLRASGADTACTADFRACLSCKPIRCGRMTAEAIPMAAQRKPTPPRRKPLARCQGQGQPPPHPNGTRRNTNTIKQLIATAPRTNRTPRRSPMRVMQIARGRARMEPRCGLPGKNAPVHQPCWRLTWHRAEPQRRPDVAIPSKSPTPTMPVTVQRTGTCQTARRR